MVHLDDALLRIDEASMPCIPLDLLFQPDNALWIALDLAGSANESAITIPDTIDGRFMTVQAQTHHRAQKGIHSWGITATAKDGYGTFGGERHSWEGLLSEGAGQAGKPVIACQSCMASHGFVLNAGYA